MKLQLNLAAKARQAFSLAEVMVAAVIAVIILTSLYAGIATNLRMIDTTRQNLRATQILVSKLEGIKLCSWGTNQLFNSTIVPSRFTDTFFPLGLYQNATNHGVTYYGTITVQPFTSDNFSTYFSGSAPSYVTNLALVSVTLNWTNGYGVKNAHIRTMSTIVAQNGIQNYVSLF